MDIFDRELRSGLSMTFFLLLLLRHAFRQILILDKKKNWKVLSWMRKPEILTLDIKNRKVLSCMKESKSLLLHFCRMSVECLLNYCPMSAEYLPNVCPMSHVSTNCPQILLNVARGQILDLFRYFSCLKCNGHLFII